MILCCGEALVDMIPNEQGAFVPHAGGAVFNTAIGLGRQGVDVGLLSGVSRDLFGALLEQTLVESSVSTAHLIRSDRPTTLAFVTIVGGKAEYAFYDENTAGRLIAPSDVAARLPDTVEAFFFGGISLAVEPCAETYLSVLETYAERRFVMVDPNIRPEFISDEARYRARLARILARATVIKISDEDLDWLDQSDRSHEEKAQDLFGDATAMVCLTLGKDGVQAFRKDGLALAAAAPSKDVVDTVGAGDAFNAGLLAELNRFGALKAEAILSLGQEELQHALQFAVAFAADTVTRAGSDPAWNFEM